MRTLSVFLISTSVAIGVTAAVAGAAQRGHYRDDDGAGRCVYYGDAEFRGPQGEIADGAEVPWIGQAWNDRISSVRCDRQCALTAYEHANFAGRSQRFFGEVRYVGDGWNDRISAMRVSCDRPGRGYGRPWRGADRSCTYYADANFSGRRGRIGEDDDGRRLGEGWNDQISSLSCDPGCSLQVFEHVDHGGASQVFSGEVGFVGPRWNDRISSMRISCGPGRPR